MRKILTLFLIATICNSAFCENSVHLKKGDVAPYEGDLLTPPYAEKVKYHLINEENLSLQVESYKKVVSLQSNNFDLSQKNLDSCNAQNDKLAGEVQSSRSMSNIERIGWFALGAFLTGLVSYGATKALK